jgi:hypothetical protein
MNARLITVVFAMEWPAGHTVSTVKPASANATASRAVGSQRIVVTTNTIGFNLVRTFLRTYP